MCKSTGKRQETTTWSGTYSVKGWQFRSTTDPSRGFTIAPTSKPGAYGHRYRIVSLPAHAHVSTFYGSIGNVGEHLSVRGTFDDKRHRYQIETNGQTATVTAISDVSGDRNV